MTRTNHQTRWNNYYNALTTYATRTGHTRVPASHTEQTESGTVTLGAWASYIRQRYRTGRLPQDRIDALNAVPGWEWGPFRPGPLTDAARDSEIITLRSSGVSLQKIGDKFGLSRQRVHQIVKTK
jgi:hypothetical protein